MAPARDASNARPMQATVRLLGPRAKATPLRVAWDMTKSALDSHAEDSPAAETGKPLPLGFLVSCIDFRYLLISTLSIYRNLSHN